MKIFNVVDIIKIARKNESVKPQKYLWHHLDHHPNPNSRHYDKEVQIAMQKLALYVLYMTHSIL